MQTFNMHPIISKDQSFNDRCDMADPFVCDKQTLQALIDESPDEYALGFLSGLFCFRQQLSILTSRPF